MTAAPTDRVSASDDDHLDQRIAALRADLTAAREKERRLRASVESREKALNRLQTQLALRGDHGAAHADHGG
jgi:septal ring factor EnvC (AmiA/AmiB activator)